VYEAEFSPKILKKIVETALRSEITPLSSLLESRIPNIKDKKLKNKSEELNKNLNKSAKLLKLFLSVHKE
jgi:hypothetical protein